MRQLILGVLFRSQTSRNAQWDDTTLFLKIKVVSHGNNTIGGFLSKVNNPPSPSGIVSSFCSLCGQILKDLTLGPRAL